MHVSEIGINVDHIGSRRPLAALERELARSRDAGFRLVEIDITPFHLIVGGEIHRPSLDGFLSATRSFDLSYTVQTGVTAPTIIFVPPRLQNVRVLVNDTEIEYAHDSPYLTVPNVSVPGTRQTVLIIWTGK